MFGELNQLLESGAVRPLPTQFFPMRETVAALARRWQKKFDWLAPQLAKHFATEVAKRNDVALKRTIRRREFEFMHLTKPVERPLDVVASMVIADDNYERRMTGEPVRGNGPA